MIYSVIDQETGEVATFACRNVFEGAQYLYDQFDLTHHDYWSLVAGAVVHAEHYNLLLIICF